MSPLLAFFLATFLLLFHSGSAGDPFAFYDWDVAYKTVSPLGVKQQVIQICCFVFFSFLPTFFFFVKVQTFLFLCLFLKKNKKVIAINGEFPAPIVNVSTNWNLVVNVLNDLDEPLLITWYFSFFFIFSQTFTKS